MKTFEAWMAKVDQFVNAKTGLSVHDLPDYNFRDAFDEGKSPNSVAVKAIKAAK